MHKRVPRRTFHKAAAATTLAMATTQLAHGQGANERIGVGCIGVANRGGQLIDAFKHHADMQIVALCDVHKPTLEKAAERVGGEPAVFDDFRRLIDRKDVDAVVIATPDHWHAVQTVTACDAGKDVYVEKPLSITIHEGRRMVEAARRNRRVVQVGTHRRSSELYAKLAALTTSGKLGKITVSRAYRLSNMYPKGIGKVRPSDPPADLNWDLWLGPRPEQPYRSNIAPYKFRWWQLYSSQMANWGIHYLDAIRWLTGELAPASVCAMGGRFAVDDDRTVPDTMEATFQFASGRLAVFGQYEAAGNPIFPRPNPNVSAPELELRGTLGTAYIGGRHIQVVPERGGQFQDRTPRIEPIEIEAQGGNSDLTTLHARNFLDCIKTREKPHADVERGHRSTTMSLLANISLAVGQRIEWDAQQERITSPKEANELLHYEYRKPWVL
ncbi:MAG: Gfo/Idh/MocA family oxidoreductase [Candidatus Nealsonbacteria bacterium]|nr:Gfo/Idh/MocA family oxidoreductase [Candidatus Nealsonbacteria bacterium]